MTKLYDLAENYRAIADLLDDPTMELGWDIRHKDD